MNILVTGANGQLGNEMRIITSQSQDRYIFTDVCQESAESVAMLQKMGGCNIATDTLQLDITDLSAIRQMVQQYDVRAIVNCAAWTNVDAAEDPSKRNLVEQLNATAPQNLAIAMKEVDGLMVHISTDYVFGKEPYNTPCNEDQQGTPTGVYGETKLLGEQKIMDVFGRNRSSIPGGDGKSVPGENSNGGFIIIRTAWLYSEFGKNFCKTMLNLTATKPQLNVVFDQCGTPTYAYDLAAVIYGIIENRRFPGNYGIYHFSNEGVTSWFDFTKMIQQIASNPATGTTAAPGSNPANGSNPTPRAACNILPCHSDEFPSPVKRPSYSVLDKTKIKQTFDITVPYWTDSLKTCIEHLIK